MLEIISIESITQQGQTQPLYCKADDDYFYFVKYLEGATANGLVKEWICGKMAQDFGFNVPCFQPAYVVQTLINSYPSFNKSNVINLPKEGVVFASQQVDFAQDFSVSNIDLVPVEKQQDLLVFDLWVRNDDRNLTPKGGNVNLLWSVENYDFYVFDHNLAFDVCDDGFLRTHVFRKSISEVYGLDLCERNDYELKLQNLVQKWDNYVSSCPKEWLEADDFSLDLEKMRNDLLDDANGAIWKRLL